MGNSFKRIYQALFLLILVILAGGVGYYILGEHLGEHRWSIGDSIYFAIITVSTVGFHELDQLDKVHGARLLTAGLILVGSAALVFFQSNITAALVEGAIGQAFRRKRMLNQIKNLSGHIVVAGLGSTGKYVVEELHACRRTFVAIDRNLEHLERVSQELCGGRMLYVHGDATEDHSLLDAGIERAAGVVAALTSDRENLYVTLSARSLNPEARIVAKVVEAEADKKMRRAGASATVSPNIIGGRRMASELMRPHVVTFLDQMLLDKDKNLRVEECDIPTGSIFIGKALRDVPLRSEANALVVAIRDESGKFHYNPGPEQELHEGHVLVVLAGVEDVQKLRKLMAESAPGDSPASRAKPLSLRPQG
jgi:voltage-gated potassium channel